jgi:hypothetical protein
MIEGMVAILDRTLQQTEEREVRGRMKRENEEGWKSSGEPKIKHTIRIISRVTDRPAI